MQTISGHSDICTVCREPLAVCGGCQSWYCDIVAARVHGAPPGWRPPGEARCDLPLLSFPDRPLPDHVCEWTGFETVRRVQHKYFSDLSLLSDPLAPGPLPVGRRSIAEYAGELGIGVDEIQPPLFDDMEDGWLTLVVERRLEGLGQVTLFGLARESEPRELAAKRSESGSWFFDMQWVYEEPRMRLDRFVQPAALGVKLVAVERALLHWYEKILLGKRIRSGGPTQGPFLAGRADIVSAYMYAHAQIKKLQLRSSDETIAVFMGERLETPISRQNIQYWRDQGYLPAR